jgi:hypothetical protein
MANDVDDALNGILALAARYDHEIRATRKRLADLERERGRLVAGTQRVFAGDPAGHDRALPPDHRPLDDGILPRLPGAHH